MQGYDESFLKTGLQFNHADEGARMDDSPVANDKNKSMFKRADIANAMKMDRIFPININYANGIAVEKGSIMGKTNSSALTNSNLAPF